jgi:hypothetical protein
MNNEQPQVPARDMMWLAVISFTLFLVLLTGVVVISYLVSIGFKLSLTQDLTAFLMIFVVMFGGFGYWMYIKYVRV